MVKSDRRERELYNLASSEQLAASNWHLAYVWQLQAFF
jgi:hypothetical protein